MVDIIPQLQRDQFVSDIHRLTIDDTRTCITVSMQENWLQAVLQIAKKKTSQTQPRQALIHGIYMEARMCYLPHGHSVKHLNVHYRCQPSVQHGRWWLVLPGQWTQVCRWTDAVVAVPFGLVVRLLLRGASHGRTPSSWLRRGTEAVACRLWPELRRRWCPAHL